MIELSDATQYLLSRVEGNLLVRPDELLEQIKFAAAIQTVMKNRDSQMYFMSELEDVQRSH